MTENRRILPVAPPFDLARTAAPVWWARGRWPSADWIDDELVSVGWEGTAAVWRAVSQRDRERIALRGNANPNLDGAWANEVLGVGAMVPSFERRELRDLAVAHAGMRPWSAGGLYEGFVSSIVGQSISVAAAAVTERRLCELFHPGIAIAGRVFWPMPRPDQLAAATVEAVRGTGVTSVRAEALIAMSGIFADMTGAPVVPRETAAALGMIRGIGRWTIESALLWGLGDADAHPSGDVALLRAARRHYPEIVTLRDLDRVAECWRPHRAWAARLLWLDLLGFPGARGEMPSEPQHSPGDRPTRPLDPAPPPAEADLTRP